jgi:hypothetical protein
MKITSVWPLIRKQQWPSCGFKFQISCLTCVPALWQSVHRRVASHQRWCFSSRACLARRRSNSNYLDVIPVGKCLIIGITPKWQFHGQKMNNHQIQAYPVFRQNQLVGPLTKSYPQFTYQLVTGIILQLPMTFLCYEHPEGRDISAALLSIATSAGQTAKPNHCSFQANRTNHFLDH